MRGWQAGLLVVLAGLALGGCSSLDSIDRRVEAMMRERSADLGPDAPPPTMRQPTDQNWDRDEQYVKTPSTSNPSAEDLTFTASDPDPQKVLKRLQAYSAEPVDPMLLDLEAAFRTAQDTGREHLSAQEEYMLSAISLLIERHLWGPRFFDDLSVALTADGLESSYTSALNVINTLRVAQRLPYGGEVEAALITRATHQLSTIVGEPGSDNTTIALSARVPLLRNAGLIAQESLIQTERDLVYAARSYEDFRRSFLVDIARDYFNLIAQQGAIRNQERRLQSVMRFQEETQARVTAGRTAAFEARRVEQDVLSSQNSLINARESYVLSIDRFKVRLGIPVARPMKIEPVSLELPEPDISVDAAAELALKYRLDYQNERDRVSDSRRAVENAKNQLLPDLDLALTANIPTDEGRRRGRFRFDPRDSDYSAVATFGLPLDRETERLNYRAAIIRFQRVERDLDQFRDNLILDARRAVREIDRARLSVELQQRTVEINERRLEEIEIKSDTVDARDRLDAETDLLDARNQLEDAIRDLRVAILEYLLVTGQLRVESDGTFKPLQGMVVRMVDTSATPAGPPAATAPGSTPPEAPITPPTATPPPDPAAPAPTTPDPTPPPDPQLPPP